MPDPMDVTPSNESESGSNKSNDNSDAPMEIDPIDDGPKIVAKNEPPPPAATADGMLPGLPGLLPGGGTNNNSALVLSGGTTPNTIPTLTKEEEALQAIEMLRGNDVSARVSAAHRLDFIAMTLGEERTRKELLPFVTDGIDDEDEVLLAMASALGRMVPAVGGPSRSHILLSPLELLLTVEESTVRQAATASALTIADAMPDDLFVKEYMAFLQKLARQEWFTARISAATLYPPAFLRLKQASKDEQEENLQLFARLCQDDTPMVRRVAAQHLGVMVHNVVAVAGRSSLHENGMVVRMLMPLYEELAHPEQPDSVRLQTTENCVMFGQVMTNLSRPQNKDESKESNKMSDEDTNNASSEPLLESELELLARIVPLIVATIDDRSWRVRWTAAAKFAMVISAYQQLVGAMDALVPAYEKLLQDPEAEVRTAATLNLAHVARCPTTVPVPSNLQAHRTPQEGGSSGNPILADGAATDGSGASGPRMSVAERLVKRVTSLTEDDSEHVRAALAKVATELAPALGKDATITYLVPPVLLLLRDAASEVRLNLIASLGALNEVIGVDLLSQSLLPAILDLAQDGKWRIRLAMIEHIPLLAKQLGREFFTEKLCSLCVGWLGDDIASIRRAAAANMRDLTALFGCEWATKNLIPPIVEIRKNSTSYLRRLTALQACAVMAHEMDSDTAKLEVLPLVVQMATDVVPNIRFNVARELQSIAPKCGLSAYEQQVLPVLTMLLDDEDRDVRYFADRAVNVLDEAFASEEAAA